MRQKSVLVPAWAAAQPRERLLTILWQRSDAPALAKRAGFGGRTLREMRLFWDLFLLCVSVDWEASPPHQ